MICEYAYFEALGSGDIFVTGLFRSVSFEDNLIALRFFFQPVRSSIVESNPPHTVAYVVTDTEFLLHNFKSLL